MACAQTRADTVCSLAIDYAQVPGDRILPFQITLNLEDSILNPVSGERQRFCYDVDGVGEDTASFADLSHLVLGICPEIPEEQIQNITVVINGVPQNVIFGEGGNVEVRTVENPDPPTGCPGLKFDFPLDKVSGRMQLCFELSVTRAVGGVDVCLFGGGVTADGLMICGPVCERIEACPVVGYQRSTVCVPITVTPYALVGTPVTTCCGDPVVTMGDTCARNGGICRFTIRQQVCIAVPVGFGARALAGTPSVQCNEASATDICTGCTTAPDSRNRP